MGAIVIRPQTPHEVLCQLNCRFAPGAALQEMIDSHTQFQIFAANNSLVQIYKLLNIGPAHHDERALYYQFLDFLRTVPSDVPGVTGHDRIIQARRDNLEHATPLPMYTTIHDAAVNPGVTVTQGQPLPHDPQTYIIISTPTRPPSAATLSQPASPSQPAPPSQPAASTRPRVRRGRKV
jgi:hypothetical protein